MTASHLFCLLCPARFALWVALSAVATAFAWLILCHFIEFIKWLTGADEQEE